MNATIETNETVPRCDCGRAISAEHRALVAAFPMVLRQGQCESCREAQERTEAKAATIQREEEERDARRARLVEIPPEMRRTQIAHPQFNPELWGRVRNWRPDGLRWLGIVGGAGECKTRCLALLARKLILEGYSLKWTTAVDFQEQVDMLLNGERGDTRRSNEYFQACKMAGVLVLDDLGKNTWNPTMERRMFALVDYRKTHDLPLLWTANTDPLAMLPLLSADRGAPMIGRILEASHIEPVTLPQPELFSIQS